MKQLQADIFHVFNNSALLKQALMHRSVTKDHNERLEFLGDGCLNFIIGYELYRLFPEANEGELSNLRAHLVKEETLAQIAKKLKLYDYMILSYGEKKNSGALRPSILADMFEAVIAAIFIDSDFNTAQQCVLKLYRPYLETLSTDSAQIVSEHVKDPKSRLQEMQQALNKGVPIYEVISISGQDHEQVFEIACSLQNQPTIAPTIARGTSKKRAEQQAAQLMLDKLL